MRIVYVLTSLGVGGRGTPGVGCGRSHGSSRPRGRCSRPKSSSRRRMAHESPHRLPEHAQNTSERPGWPDTSPSFPSRLPPDLLHSHSFHANIVARLLKLLVPSTKTAATVNNFYEGGRLRMLAYRLTDVLASRTTAVSQAAADRFILLKAIPREKCLVLPNGNDLAASAPSKEHRTNTRTEMAAGDSFIWLAAGRLVLAKDFPNLLRAFKQIRAADPNTQLWIAGAPAEAMSKMTVDGRSGFVSGFVAERSSMD